MPPIEVTSGSADGQELTRYGYRSLPFSIASVAPLSPDAASTVTSLAAAKRKAYRRLSMDLKSPLSKPGKVFSVAPKLCEITSTSRCCTIDFSASIISGRPVTPSVSATPVSTRTMCASGATACAYSTSRVVSPAQPVCSPLVGSNGGTSPHLTTSTWVSGMPHCLSNTSRSCWMVGEPKESTITMVRPLPVTPCRYSGSRL